MSETRPDSSSAKEPTDGDSWIFEPEPGAFITEKLPDREDFERVRAEKAELDSAPERRFAPLDSLSEDRVRPASGLAGSPASGHEAAPNSFAHALGLHSNPVPASAREGSAAVLPAEIRREATTPAVAPGRGTAILPPRFSDVSGWDALRDLLAALCFISSFATPLTLVDGAVPLLFSRIAAGIGLLTLVVVYLLRWVPTYRVTYDPAQPPNLRLIGVLRKIGMLPAFAVAVGVILFDLIVSLPVLLTPLPEGPSVGIGAGVALLLLGAVVGSERRGFEGYAPDDKAKGKAYLTLRVFFILALISFALALVMMVGKALGGDHLFALMTLARSLGALTFVLLILRPGLYRVPAWYVFLTGVAGAMVIGGAVDNTFRFEYAAPASFSTAYVWLPFLFAGFGILVSRAYVRSSSLRFSRVDWLVYAARAFEFSVIMHAVAVVIAILQTLAILGGYDAHMGVVLSVINVVFLGVLLWLSHGALKALAYADAHKARSHAVAACVTLTVLGFIGILVYTLASGAAAGLLNGGLALVIGIIGALMITVPEPVRDEYGAPDFPRTFREFRARENGHQQESEHLRFLPDISRERATRKAFPA